MSRPPSQGAQHNGLTEVSQGLVAVRDFELAYRRFGSQREVALFGLMSASPSRPGKLHPEPLTDPDLTLSRHPARAITRRLPPSIEHRVPPVSG